MAERKPCIRCERPIDANARSCVYCNWDQGVTKPVVTAAPLAAPTYVPPRDTRLRNRILGAIAFVALVVIAFVVGSLVHGSDPSQAKASQTPAHPAAPTAQAEGGPKADVTLVPLDGSMQSEPPITSAPAVAPSAGNVEVNGDRTDATALPSGEYSAAAQRAKAERDVRTNNGMIDPRTIPGGVEHAVPVNRARPQLPQQRNQVIRVAAPPHTEPIPLYQPVPPLRVQRPSSARLFLTVGTDGRVHDIDIAQSIPGEMPRLIASVQNWRFRPATQNGQPVTSTFSVDINVRPQ
ncbi:MAG TPA: energy transducer TonB [Thermoanaerobaculia bacterium]|jgi:cell division septation protein DedD|nr:energy transducer TonB [Thermoanaerobaculia bacterium]